MAEKEKTVRRIAIQGYPGSFHEEAAHAFWRKEQIDVLPADTFDQLAQMLSSGTADMAVMAIENSIAGTILQNYRILREYGFSVTGEIYLRIRHQLLGVPGTTLSGVKQVNSHPMALNQCLQFLSGFPDWQRIETIDTALSAKHLSESGNNQVVCIASAAAARHYNLHILAENIETHTQNYTRFFILSRTKQPYPDGADKASVFIRIPDKKGQLLKVLQWIQEADVNMSQLQSFPVLGAWREYYFHLDVEFDTLDQYALLKDTLLAQDVGFQETGVYCSADLATLFNESKTLY